MKKPESTSQIVTSTPYRSSRYETGRAYANPLYYDHPWPSMEEYAKRLNLRHDAVRTCHSYYRDMQLIHKHFDCDPASLNEEQIRDYFLYVKTVKRWKPKTIRQSLACAKIFYVEMLGHVDWKVFSQIKTKDHDLLPAVLTRRQVHDLIAHIRLRRYRTPIKLIYCCELRLSECLGLTIQALRGHKHINSTMVYLHLTHRSEQDPLDWKQSSRKPSGHDRKDAHCSVKGRIEPLDFWRCG